MRTKSLRYWLSQKIQNLLAREPVAVPRSPKPKAVGSTPTAGARPSYVSGFYAAGDELMQWMNSLDSSEMTPRQVRSAVFRKILEMRP